MGVKSLHLLLCTFEIYDSQTNISQFLDAGATLEVKKLAHLYHKFVTLTPNPPVKNPLSAPVKINEIPGVVGGKVAGLGRVSDDNDLDAAEGLGGMSSMRRGPKIGLSFLGEILLRSEMTSSVVLSLVLIDSYSDISVY